MFALVWDQFDTRFGENNFSGEEESEFVHGLNMFTYYLSSTNLAIFFDCIFA